MTMTHAEIDTQDLIDRYVRRDLDAATAEAFEQHYFACDRCFAQVQELEALRAAVAEMDDATPALAPVSRPFMTWLFMAASLALAAGLGWMVLVRVPGLQQQLDVVTADRDRLQAAPPVIATPPDAPLATPNVALLVVSAERGADVPTVTLSRGAPGVLLAIDAGPSPDGRARLTIARDGGPVVLSIDDLRRTDAGVWTVSLPSARLAPGTYRLRLTSAGAGAAGVLIGEYLIRVQ